MQPDEDSAVASFLRRHPAFLAANPSLYDTLTPPSRIHGPAIADHLAAMVHRARARASEAERAAQATAGDRRTAEAFTRRVQEAVVALMRAPDPAWLATHELAGLLRLDSARIAAEAEPPPDGTAPIPRGTVAATLGQRSVLIRPASPNHLLHGEALARAAQEALIRIPIWGGPAILALACSDPADMLGATADALAFLGQAVGAALDTVSPACARPA